VGLEVSYQDTTINRKPETQNRRLKLTGLGKRGKTRGLTCTAPGLAGQDPAVQVVGRLWNRTKQFLPSKPGPQAGYLDLLLTLVMSVMLDKFLSAIVYYQVVRCVLHSV
jgi:hypothetical protein